MPTAAVFAIEIPDVVMELKMLDTVKQRAEGRAGSAWVTLYEIGVWLAAFGMTLAAFVQVVRRPDWRRSLAVMAAAVIVLLALTFLFPPLWLRGVLALGLLAGLAMPARR